MQKRKLIIYIEVIDIIVFSQMHAKYTYNEKHQFLFIKIKNFAFIRLHRNYDILSIVILEKKFSQQYVDLFKILERIEHLVYRLNLLSH